MAGVGLVLCAPVCGASAGEEEPETMTPARTNGLTVGEGGVLLKDGKPYRGVGINYFSAFNRRLADHDDTSYREGFAELAERDIPFVRFAACGFWPVNWQLYFEDKEAYFRILDDVVRAAEENGLGLIPSLFWWYACVPDLVEEPMGQWGNPDSRTIAFMRRYTEEVVTRYLDSPAIWAWEFGNEYSLTADLPNAADHRPWVRTDLGTAETRSHADDMTHDMVITACREFGEVVRRIDKTRPITTGHSLPRPAAHHMRTELSWTRDTHHEFTANLLAVTPDPHDLVAVHIYPSDHLKRFGEERVSYQETVLLCMKAARGAHKALFVGEFGAPDREEDGGPDRARRENLAMINAIDLCAAPLAALWNFDLPHQEDFINVTTTNKRSYLLDALRNASRRIALYASGDHKADIGKGGLLGRLLDNEANADRAGSGFNPLYHALFPGQNLYDGGLVGLNFEHIFNGTVADRDITMFTPRKDPCTVVRHSETSASLRWPAEGSAWGMACEMKYTLVGENAVDLEFAATPTTAKFPLGYAAMMWASYMNHTRDRTIHFYGKSDQEGWVSFGDDTDDGFETGTVSYYGVADLPYEESAETLNVIEHPKKKFLLPFFYGLVDGDGDPATTDDTMVYIMMFDQVAPIRFALWNFNRDATGKPDPTRPAWDWQYVIRGPELGKTYGYKARVVYKPFVSPEDVRREYETWAGNPNRVQHKREQDQVGQSSV